MFLPLKKFIYAKYITYNHQTTVQTETNGKQPICLKLKKLR